jgi:hypothetical protein
MKFSLRALLGVRQRLEAASLPFILGERLPSDHPLVSRIGRVMRWFGPDQWDETTIYVVVTNCSLPEPKHGYSWPDARIHRNRSHRRPG